MAHPDRWQHLEGVSHAALARDEAERTPFVREACRGDESLRLDIESLLRFERDAQAFMQAPASSLIQETTTPLVGQCLGPYEIGALLGAGGMGDVYRARDTTLGRDVAIKILPAGRLHGRRQSSRAVRARGAGAGRAESSARRRHLRGRAA